MYICKHILTFICICMVYACNMFLGALRTFPAASFFIFSKLYLIYVMPTNRFCLFSDFCCFCFCSFCNAQQNFELLLESIFYLLFILLLLLLRFVLNIKKFGLLKNRIFQRGMSSYGDAGGVLVVRSRDKSRKRGSQKGKATYYINIIVFRISFLFHFHLQFQYKCKYLKFQLMCV